MLEVIEVALENLLKSQNISVNQQDRLNLARDLFLADSFSRQEYLRYFKTISTATASRDLKYGVEKGYLEKSGDKRMTKYKFKRIPNRKLTQD